jgi:hypothetical protein
MLAAMQASAASMAASAVVMTEQVTAAVSAVKTLSTKLDDAVTALTEKIADVDAKADATTDELHRIQLEPVRARMATLPGIAGPSIPVGSVPAPAPTSSQPPPPAYVSISPLEAAVSGASIHAVTNEVPRARKENRALSIVIAVLIVLAQAIQMARGH